jgi:hypothetical protein
METLYQPSAKWNKRDPTTAGHRTKLNRYRIEMKTRFR